MPYIKKANRELLPDFDGFDFSNPGELNYAITRLCDHYLCTRENLNYTAINEVIGALECAKMELYRRIAAKYEDHKMRENGDVYDAPPAQW